MPLYFSSRDFLVLHASAVATKTGALLFMGSSGVGKSTISTLLLPYWQMISDDFVVCLPGGNFDVSSSYPMARLWEKHPLGKDLTIQEALLGNDKQRFKLPADKFALEQRPMRAVFILSRNSLLSAGQIEISRVLPQEFFAKVMSNLFVLETNSLQRQTWIFEKLTNLVNIVPAYQLEFSDLRDFGDKLYESLKEYE